MKKEQYERAIQIHYRIDALENIKADLSRVDNKLTYVSKSKGEELYPYDFKHISDILDKHDLQIRAEIDAEIESWEKEIKTL